LINFWPAVPGTVYIIIVFIPLKFHTQFPTPPNSGDTILNYFQEINVTPRTLFQSVFLQTFGDHHRSGTVFLARQVQIFAPKWRFLKKVDDIYFGPHQALILLNRHNYDGFFAVSKIRDVRERKSGTSVKY